MQNLVKPQNKIFTEIYSFQNTKMLKLTVCEIFSPGNTVQFKEKEPLYIHYKVDFIIL